MQARPLPARGGGSSLSLEDASGYGGDRPFHTPERQRGPLRSPPGAADLQPDDGTVDVKIFIGSSREARDNDLLHDVASWVEDAGHEPLRWDNPEAMTLGLHTLTALRRIARSVDGAIFIFSEDDRVWYRNGDAHQPRDNVLLEYGLFSAILGQEKVIICRAGDPKTASDVLGINWVELSKRSMARAEKHVRTWLKSSMAEYNEALAVKALKSPFQASGKRTLFEKGTELLLKAKHRVALVAKTPIILAGCRPYDGSSSPFSYEAEQMRVYADLMERSASGNGPEFVCVAARGAVAAELAANRDTILPQRMRENYESMARKLAMPQSRMTLRWYDGSAPMTFLVSDDDFMIWFKDASGESVWITARDEVIARALYSRAHAIGDVLDDAAALRAINGEA
ncbi:hypothetical protein GCM10020358_55980 [Amorphoplanes nipponensis]